jgi:phospholipase/carboxylesterase
MIEYTHGWLTKHTRLTKVLYSNMWHSISQQNWPTCASSSR